MASTETSEVIQRAKLAEFAQNGSRQSPINPTNYNTFAKEASFACRAMSPVAFVRGDWVATCSEDVDVAEWAVICRRKN